MAVKILLADKSITIQKVVEMLFSGREYDVACVSDGDTALREAARIVPDVVLADVDLPRADGYSLSLQLKKTTALANIPVILMMSRDDVYDNAKGNQSGIADKIVKPFESQELIGKVKKALASAPPRPAEPRRPAPVTPSQPAGTAPLRAPQPASPPKKQAPPADIFDIISDAPTPAEIKQTSSPVEEEIVYEVEPVVEEIEAPFAPEKALPTGTKAVEEMRAGLGLIVEGEGTQPDIISFESFDKALETGPSAASPKPPLSTSSASPPEQPEIVPFSSLDMSRDVEQLFAPLKPETPVFPARDAVKEPVQQPALPTAELRKIVEETVSRMAADVIKDVVTPQLPKISDETIRRGIQEAVTALAREIAREVIEQVAWEVIPQLAEHLIKEEIERLKAGT